MVSCTNVAKTPTGVCRHQVYILYTPTLYRLAISLENYLISLLPVIKIRLLSQTRPRTRLTRENPASHFGIH